VRKWGNSRSICLVFVCGARLVFGGCGFVMGMSAYVCLAVVIAAREIVMAGVCGDGGDGGMVVIESAIPR